MGSIPGRKVWMFWIFMKAAPVERRGRSQENAAQ
jgi:hypothetical protein